MKFYDKFTVKGIQYGTLAEPKGEYIIWLAAVEIGPLYIALRELDENRTVYHSWDTKEYKNLKALYDE